MVFYSTEKGGSGDGIWAAHSIHKHIYIKAASKVSAMIQAGHLTRCYGKGRSIKEQPRKREFLLENNQVTSPLHRNTI